MCENAYHQNAKRIGNQLLYIVMVSAHDHFSLITLLLSLNEDYLKQAKFHPIKHKKRAYVCSVVGRETHCCVHPETTRSSFSLRG